MELPWDEDSLGSLPSDICVILVRIVKCGFQIHKREGFVLNMGCASYVAGSDWGMLDDEDALVFVDNHDNQRGSGGGGQNIITYKQPKLYKVCCYN